MRDILGARIYSEFVIVCNQSLGLPKRMLALVKATAKIKRKAVEKEKKIVIKALKRK